MSGGAVLEQDAEGFDFDMLTTPDSVRILKPLLPYVPESLQKHLAVFIKLKELLYITSSFSEIQQQFSKKELTDFDFSSFKRYCSKEQLEMVNQMESMKTAFEMYSQYSDLMGQMGAFTAEAETPANSSNANPDSDTDTDTGTDTMSATIMNFLTEEQRAMYEKFKNL